MSIREQGERGVWRWLGLLRASALGLLLVLLSPPTARGAPPPAGTVVVWYEGRDGAPTRVGPLAKMVGSVLGEAGYRTVKSSDFKRAIAALHLAKPLQREQLLAAAEKVAATRVLHVVGTKNATGSLMLQVAIYRVGSTEQIDLEPFKVEGKKINRTVSKALAKVILVGLSREPQPPPAPAADEGTGDSDPQTDTVAAEPAAQPDEASAMATSPADQAGEEESSVSADGPAGEELREDPLAAESGDTGEELSAAAEADHAEPGDELAESSEAGPTGDDESGEAASPSPGATETTLAAMETTATDTGPEIAIVDALAVAGVALGGIMVGGGLLYGLRSVGPRGDFSSPDRRAGRTLGAGLGIAGAGVGVMVLSGVLWALWPDDDAAGSHAAMAVALSPTGAAVQLALPW